MDFKGFCGTGYFGRGKPAIAVSGRDVWLQVSKSQVLKAQKWSQLFSRLHFDMRRQTLKLILLPPEASYRVSPEVTIVLLWREKYLPNGRYSHFYGLAEGILVSNRISWLWPRTPVFR